MKKRINKAFNWYHNRLHGHGDSYLIARRSKTRKGEATKRAQGQSKWNYPGLMSRQRAPSIDSDTTSDAPSYCQQEQSRLFLLPLELRNQIYEFTLGGHLIHLRYCGTHPPWPQFWQRPIWALACEKPQQIHKINIEYDLHPFDEAEDGMTDDSLHYCKLYVPTSGFLDTLVPDLKLLSLPRTCRRIYTESIDYIYRANTFDMSCDLVSNLDHNLIPHILPQRLACIRSVRLHIHLFDCASQWTTTPQKYSVEYFMTEYPMMWASFFERLSGLLELEVILESSSLRLLHGRPLAPPDAWGSNRKRLGGFILGPLQSACAKLRRLDVMTTLEKEIFDEKDFKKFKTLRLLDHEGRHLFGSAQGFVTDNYEEGTMSFDEAG